MNDDQRAGLIKPFFRNPRESDIADANPNRGFIYNVDANRSQFEVEFLPEIFDMDELISAIEKVSGENLCQIK
jgi:hypothetical protein